MSELLEHVKAAKFPYWQETIHLFVGGSALHGASVGSQDLDICGVFVEPPEKALGIDRFEHFISSSSDSSQRNTAEDTDISLYGLRHWAHLLCKGNPTIVQYLFAENTLVQATNADTWFHVVRSKRMTFLAQSHHKAFFGYAESQLQRIKGERGMKVHRPELVEQFGYDTKFAMHVIRLLTECKQLMSEGVITFPNPQRQTLLDIRNGKFTLEEVSEQADQLFSEIKNALPNSPLPVNINRENVSKVIAEGYRMHWQKWRL